MQKQVTHVTLPQTYLRLYAEEMFLDSHEGLGALGLNKRSFRALCKALQVPMIEVGNTRLVDALSLSIALRSVLRIGQPNFYAPGSESIKRGDTSDGVRSLPDDALSEEALRTVCLELLAARKLASGQKLTVSIRKQAEAAVHRMKVAGILQGPLLEQEDHARTLLKTADNMEDLPDAS